jgi:Uma2 family endonuclease
MGMPSPISPPPSVWTADMARALPDDGNRYEVLDGELFVTPAPSAPHQQAAGRLFTILDAYVSANGLGVALFSPADIEFGPGRLLQPDLFVAPPTPSGRIRSWRDITSLLLSVEITSPSTARADRLRKRTIYQSQGVPEYWIVDLDARVVERWRPGDERPEILADTVAWAPRADATPLEIDLPRYFASVLD